MSNCVEKCIQYMESKKGKIGYSMNYCRTGANCNTGDCSGTIWYGLVLGGLPKTTNYPLNTVSIRPWLLNNGFKMIAQNRSWIMERGDIIICGNKTGGSSHMAIAINPKDIIHCNYSKNGISVDNENIMPYSKGFNVYRYYGKSNQQPSVDSVDKLANDVISGKYGVGDQRRKLLGSKYDEVQKRVNEMLTGKQNVDLNKLADEVLQGKHGNGDTRRKSLGIHFDEVQKLVNKKLKK